MRPMYTADMLTESNWHNRKQHTKTYNMNSTPSLSPSASSTSSNASSAGVADSECPVHHAYSTCGDTSATAPLPPTRPKRPLSAEVLIKIMDKRLFKKKQRELQRAQEEQWMHYQTLRTPNLSSAASSSSSSSSPQTSSRLNGLIHLKPSSSSHSRKQSLKKKLRSTPKDQPTKNNITTVKKMASHTPMLSTNTNSNHDVFPYVLTQDNDEQDRMVTQHYILRTAFGADYMSPIRTRLEQGIIVLDVGCGPGTWTMEMGTTFPNSTFIGIDQAAFFPKDIKPRNCHFRTCGPLLVGQQGKEDLTLPFPDNSIDYIYQRDMNWGLTAQTWQPLLLEYQRILKPGGWIECVEPDLSTQNSLGNECAMNDKLISGLAMRQQDPYAVHRLPTVLAINGFRQVEDISQTLPLGWGSFYDATNKSTSTLSSTKTAKRSSQSSHADAESSSNQECSTFAKAVSSQYLYMLKSLKPWLSDMMHMSSQKYDAYIASLPEEWVRARTFVKWHSIIAQKPFV
ncbi:putative methyltransferase C1B3.06c [Choanephora cucurbitarum]|uniref:Putative methyltransferase C1B3.06c n=1 Tax=Choanephora cucurbitarum TaxID=101091 RepID=A0A1C7NP57_9FUNG|nr:putative methyltransferase C1B3.06c [Choanephora cucurbitarum]